MTYENNYSSESQPILLPPGFDHIVNLDRETGISWIVANLFMPGELVGISTDRRRDRGLMNRLINHWVLQVSRRRRVLCVTSDPQALFHEAHLLAEYQSVSLEDYLSNVDLTVKYSPESGEDWTLIADIAVKLACRLIVILPSSSKLPDDAVEHLQRAATLGSAVVVSNAFGSVFADEADVLLVCEEQSLGSRLTIDPAKMPAGTPKRQFREYVVESKLGILIPRDDQPF